MTKNILDEISTYKSDNWLDDFGCTVTDILNLESIINPQSEFDGVLGR